MSQGDLPPRNAIFGLGLAYQAPKTIELIPKSHPLPNHLRKKKSLSAKYRLPLCYKKR